MQAVIVRQQSIHTAGSIKTSGKGKATRACSQRLEVDLKTSPWQGEVRVPTRRVGRVSDCDCFYSKLPHNLLNESS